MRERCDVLDRLRRLITYAEAWWLWAAVLGAVLLLAVIDRLTNILGR